MNETRLAELYALVNDHGRRDALDEIVAEVKRLRIKYEEAMSASVATRKQITLMRDAAEAVLRGDDPYGAICAIRYVDATYVPTEEDRKRLEPIVREIEARKTTPVSRVLIKLSDFDRLENERKALREAAQAVLDAIDHPYTPAEAALHRALTVALREYAPKEHSPERDG